MEVTSNGKQAQTTIDQLKERGQQRLESMVDAFRRPILGLDTTALAEAVAKFSNPEKTEADIVELLKSTGSSATEVAEFQREMAQAIANKHNYDSERVLGVAVEPFIDTLTDVKTHKKNFLDGTAAMSQMLGGVGQSYLAALTGFTPMGAFLGMHGASNISGGFGDLYNIVIGNNADVDLNFTRQGYENIAEFAGADKSIGETAHTMVGVATAGYGLLAQRNTVLHAGSALEQVTKVPAVAVSSNTEIASEIAQAVDTIYEANR